MKYLVLEDEPLAAEKLIRGIQELRPDWQHLGTLASISEGFKLLTTMELDVIFVDIHLADGLSFALFKDQPFNTPLIFTTAYDQYALKAFELNSIDYLLKPVTQTDLERAILKLESRSDDVPIEWRKLISDLQVRYKERFLVSTGERIRAVKSEDIAFFYAQGKHCFLTDKEGVEYLIDQTLSQLNNLLNPAHFFQINRQLIVQLNYIQEMIPMSKSRLKLVLRPATPEDAIVSVERSARFKSWMAGD